MSFASILRAWLALVLALALGACASGPTSRLGSVAVWTSSADGARKLAKVQDLPLLPVRKVGQGEAVTHVITVEPQQRFQEIVGFGAAMTDASALLFEKRLSKPQRDALFAELFGADGLALSFLRVPIGASDFSERHYSFDDMPSGETDPTLARFSLDPARDAQIPALKAARAVNPQLVLMASPWSAPGWMKDSGSLVKGRLRPEYYDAFARYLLRYLEAMDAEGLPVRWLSIQNEPHFEPANYSGMRLDPAARADVIGRHLGPLLERSGRTVGVLEWDHNWNEPESPLAVLADPRAARHVAGVAWHCYAGEPEAMEQVRAAYPDKDVFFSECSGGEWAPEWGKSLGWMIDKLVIAPSRYGSRGTLLWNLALDENHGPHKGGCGDCRGVVTIDSRTGAITRNVEYYVLGHASRFVRQGAHRVASSESGPVSNAAFRNPDGSLVLLVHNRSAQAAVVAVVDGRSRFTASLPGGELATFTWRHNGEGQP